jgi:hypothetical protein
MPDEQQKLTEAQESARQRQADDLKHEQEQAGVFDFAKQQEARAVLAHARVVQELNDAAAQGAKFTPEQAAEVRKLLDQASDTPAKRGTGK